MSIGGIAWYRQRRPSGASGRDARSEPELLHQQTAPRRTQHMLDARHPRRDNSGPAELLSSFRITGRPRGETMPAPPPPAPSWGARSLPAPAPSGRVSDDRHASVSGRAGAASGAAALGAAGAAAAAGTATAVGTAGQRASDGSGSGPDPGARSRPRSSFGANDAMETVKLLAAGGVAGAVSKSATAPLARLTILYQVRRPALTLW